MAKRFNLDENVRLCANNGSEICKKLVEIADNNKFGSDKPYSMTQICYFAISTEAHKEHVFRKGYNKFNEVAAKVVMDMIRYWGEYNGNIRLSREANVAHAMTKVYKKLYLATNADEVMDLFKAKCAECWIPYQGKSKTMKEITAAFGLEK